MKITLHSMKGGSDYEPFAIANATALCYGGNLSSVVYDQSLMRKHSMNTKQKIKPFPKIMAEVENFEVSTI